MYIVYVIMYVLCFVYYISDANTYICIVYEIK